MQRAVRQCVAGMVAGLLLAGFAGCDKQPAKIRRLGADEPIRVEARVDRAVAAVGDKILFVVQAVARKYLVVDLPVDLEVTDGMQIKDVQTPKEKMLGKDQVILRREWSLSPEKVGSYILKPLSVQYRKGNENKAVKTAAVYIDVKSVLKEGDLEGDIKDIKGPVDLLSIWWVGLGVFAGLVVLTVLALAVYRWLKRRPVRLTELLPHEWALRELERLLKSHLLADGLYKEFAQQLSLIFRVYVERRFGIMAPERTTEEFVVLMRGSAQFAADQQSWIGQFLVFCDVVKFAKYAPTAEEMSQGVTIVRNFVDQTRPVENPDEGKAASAAGEKNVVRK